MSGRTLFSIGFSLSLFLFIAANIYSYVMVEPHCCDLPVPFGFPKELGMYGGFVATTTFILSGLIADTVICLAVSVFSGWLFARAIPRIFAVAGSVAAWHARTRL